MAEWWVSSKRITAWVETGRQRIITDAAPVLKRFKGQPLRSLEGWMKKQGGFKIERLPKRERDN